LCAEETIAGCCQHAFAHNRLHYFFLEGLALRYRSICRNELHFTQ